MSRDHSDNVERLVECLKEVAAERTLITYRDASQASGVAPGQPLFAVLNEAQALAPTLGCDLSSLVVNPDTRRPGSGWWNGRTEEDWQDARDKCYARFGRSPVAGADPNIGLASEPEVVAQERRVEALREAIPGFAREMSRALRHIQRDPRAAAVAVRVAVEWLLREVAGRAAPPKAMLGKLLPLLRDVLPSEIQQHVTRVKEAGDPAAHPDDARLTPADVSLAVESALAIGEWAVSGVTGPWRGSGPSTGERT